MQCHCLLQTKLLGAALDPSSHNSNGAQLPPTRSRYGPYSPSAIEAARRRTQELYNARRSQLGAPAPQSNKPTVPPPPPLSASNRQQIWGSVSGKPHTGSYVIGDRRVDVADHSFYRPSDASPRSIMSGTDSDSTVHSPSQTARHHTMIIEAAVEPHQPNSPDAPGGTSTTPTDSTRTCFHFTTVLFYLFCFILFVCIR